MSISNPHQLDLRNIDTFLEVNTGHLNRQRPSRSRSPVSVSLQAPDTKQDPGRGSLESASDLLSEYHFPLPPSSRPSSRAAHSATQGSRPSSPLPPLYPSPLSINPHQNTSKANKKSETRTRSRDSSRSSRSDNINTQQVSKLKPLPARPAHDPHENESDETMKGKQHLFQFMRPDAGATAEIVETARSISLTSRTGGAKGHPAVTTIETRSPIAADKKQQEVNDGMPEKEAHGVQHHRAVSEGRLRTCAPPEAAKQDQGRPLHKQGLTPDEIIWLHKNYRGEATFLKAWGLHFTRDADREQGREILQVLMAAESQKGEKSSRDEAESKYSPSGDGAGLRVIQEATATNFTT